MYRPLQNGEQTIRFGIGKGLRFDPAGGNPGYALGAIALPEQQFLAENLRAGQTFYDIGANVGFFAVLGAKLVGPAGRVYAFEPYLASAKAVADNAARNGFAHVNVFNAAAGRCNGHASLLLDGTCGEFHVADGDAGDSAGRTPVSVVAIDHLVQKNECSPPHLVMIDVEGAEIDVLHGMSNTITRFRPIVVCEVHGRGDQFARACDSLFSPANYKVTTLDGSQFPREEACRFHALMMPIGCNS